MKRKTLALLVLAALTAACSPSAGSPTPRPVSTGSLEISTRTATPAPSASASIDSSAPSDTVWLCRPGMADNPCAGDLSATLVDAGGKTTVEKAQPAADPPIDCFYVYPTVSRQKSANATLAIDPEEVAVAKAQAALFSRVCDVYAPIYPQITQTALENPTTLTMDSALTAYQGVRSAWRDYMAHYNDGRGVVLIGHSQGSFMLTALIRGDVDAAPEVRARLVSALLIGGNVAEGDFDHIPACTSATQTGCVVAYSSFASTPPADAYFGRVASPINPLGRSASDSVLCVNPAAPAGGKGSLLPYFPTSGMESVLDDVDLKIWPAAKTPYAAFPDEYSAECRTSGEFTYLLVSRATGASDVRPGLPALTKPQWGLHVLDVNLALGNLVELVASQSEAYAQ
jgi:hypothetical protein